MLVSMRILFSVTYLNCLFLPQVPFSCLVVDDPALDGSGSRKRQIHDNSITRASIRANGWDYNQGSKMRAVEIPKKRKKNLVLRLFKAFF